MNHSEKSNEVTLVRRKRIPTPTQRHTKTVTVYQPYKIHVDRSIINNALVTLKCLSNAYWEERHEYPKFGQKVKFRRKTKVNSVNICPFSADRTETKIFVSSLSTVQTT